MSTQMEAGREMDAVIHERIFGDEVERDYPCGWSVDGLELPNTREEAATRSDMFTELTAVYRRVHANGWRQPIEVPFYSTDIAAAWKVVDALHAKDWTLSLFNSTAQPPLWQAVFDHPDGGEVSEWADSAPLAIVRAALAALATPTPER